METESRICRCGVEIPLGRIKALPNTTTCVNCSTVKAKRPVTVMLGDVKKDDTCIETIFLDSDVYDKYMEIESKLYKKQLLNPIPKTQNPKDESE